MQATKEKLLFGIRWQCIKIQPTCWYRLIKVIAVRMNFWPRAICREEGTVKALLGIVLWVWNTWHGRLLFSWYDSWNSLNGMKLTKKGWFALEGIVECTPQSFYNTNSGLLAKQLFNSHTEMSYVENDHLYPNTKILQKFNLVVSLTCDKSTMGVNKAWPYSSHCGC